MRKKTLLGVVTAVSALIGCTNGSPTAPTAPVEILATKYTLACRNWAPATPPVSRTLVDIRVRGTGDKVAEPELAVLRQHGADVIHQYAAGRLVRVAMNIDRLLAVYHPIWLVSEGNLIA